MCLIGASTCSADWHSPSSCDAVSTAASATGPAEDALNTTATADTSSSVRE